MSELERAIAAIQQGAPERGCELLSQWLERNPGRAEIHQMLALTQATLGRTQDAITSLRSAVATDPRLASAHYNLGTLLQQSGQSQAALQELRVTVAQDPKHERAWINLSATAFELVELTLAEVAARKALELGPKSLEAWVNLGNALKGQSRMAQALGAYEQALLIDPNYEVAASNALLARCYIEQDADPLSAAHQRNGARIAATIPARVCPARKPQKQMRIGYISGDFRFHAVAYFFGSLLKCHDRSQFDVCLYSDAERADTVSQQMARAATAWFDVTKLSDEKLWAKIRDDCIDVLVDLSGHTGRRLGVFARRAAATQITWLGYPFSTGLTTMDYRITDDIADPLESQALHTEQLLRLPNAFLCYQPPLGAPDVAPAPLIKNGYVTFGSFNHLSKLSDDTVVLYSAILQNCPESRLVLKCKSLADASTRAATQERFVAVGIAAERLQLLGRDDNPASHLAKYGLIDIALDPTPYNGTTTTFEALFMGVPVLTLKGRWHASRVGASILTNLGFDTLVASTPEHLLLLASSLSSNRQDLIQLRAVLRNLLLKSSLCDAVAFTRSFEKALVAAYSTQRAAQGANGF